MRKLLILLTLILALPTVAKDYSVKSPDSKIDITVSVGDDVKWSVSADGNLLLSPSAIAMKMTDGSAFAIKPKVAKTKTSSHRTSIATPLYKKASVDDNYNQLTIDFKGGYSLEFRAYDDGAAYRFVSDRKGTMTVESETAQFNFPDNFMAYIPYVNDNRGGERYTYSFESFYDEQRLNDMYPDSIAITPLLVDEGAYKVAVSDFGIDDYPGMYLKGSGDKGLVAEFATVPLEGFMGGYNELNYIPTVRADYIAADVKGKRAFPWRALIISRNDTQLANNDMAMRLSGSSRIADTSWIKPGKVAWDWWNNLHVTGVDFKVGRNTQTYKYFIDFAHDNGLEYIIVDEGWSDANSILKTIGDIDVKQLVDYGKSKDVGVILWASWKNVHNELDEAMRHYADMGVAGFKVDFFDADDQNMVRDMMRFAQVAADNHLVLDYHGMKANGMQVLYPNILNFEGVKGLENYRWSSTENNPPRYAVTIPYIRTLIGPMDYTPGAMVNMNTAEHRADNDNPKSEGTRAHQVAMYVVYDAPLQMLADSPTRYKANQHCADFMSAVPTVFDETLILDGKVGEYIITAKRAGDTWYIGAMTNRQPREITIDLSMLGSGLYDMELIEDGLNTSIDASDHRHTTKRVDKATTVKAHLAPAGGWAAIIKPL